MILLETYMYERHMTNMALNTPMRTICSIDIDLGIGNEDGTIEIVALGDEHPQSLLESSESRRLNKTFRYC